MAPLRSLLHGLRVLRGRRAADAETDEELKHWFDQAVEERVARGEPRESALRAVRAELGSMDAAREQVRESGWENTVETLWRDVRYAARRLRASPGFTFVAVITLALGVGGTTAVYSALDRVLFEPLPYPEPDRVAMVWEIAGDGRRVDGTFGMYSALAARVRSFEALAAMKPWQVTHSGADQPELYAGQRVSATYLRVLGVVPALGRDFVAADDVANGPNVVIIGDALWRRRFGADPAMLEHPVTLDGVDYTVVGVLPAGFENAAAPTAEIFAPLQYDLTQGRAWGHHLRVVGRLQRGASAEAAAGELDALARDVLGEQRPSTYGPHVAFSVVALQDDVTRVAKPALLAIFAAMVLVLVIACVNVTNLLLARGSLREGEFALRAALGARRSRIVRQLLTESILLALLGGVAGLLLAIAGIGALSALAPPGLPRLGAATLDGTAFALCLVVTGAIGIAFGLVPARKAARGDPQRALAHGNARTVRSSGGVRRVLVAVEVALAVVLLVSSTLLLRSLDHLFAVDPGFEPEAVLTLQVQLSGPRYSDDDAARRFYADALHAVRAVPGVATAGFTSQLPLSGDEDLYGVHFDPAPVHDPGAIRGAYRHAVTAGFLETLRIAPRRGRLLTPHDRADAARVALISESLARHRLPDRDPIGARLRIGATDGPLYTVVGVVADVRHAGLASDASDAVYVPAAQWPFADRTMSLVVRAHAGPATLAGAKLAEALRAAIWSVDPQQAIVRVATMDDLVAASGADRRFALLLFQAFALVAVLLAAAGIYGLQAGSVAERSRELALRVALGAVPRDVVALIVRQGMMLTAVGLLVGIAGAIAASRALDTLLFGVTALDPVSYVAALALLAIVALVACALPAWRAVRLDSAAVLRAE